MNTPTPTARMVQVLADLSGKAHTNLATGKVSKPRRKKTKTKTITLDAKRWFSKSVGSTYHSVTILVNGKQVYRVDFAYGYGDQYQWTAAKHLASLGHLPGIRSPESLWRYCDRMKIHLMNFVSDVGRKKDL